MRAKIVGVLLVFGILIATGASSSCNLQVDTANVVLTLSPSSNYCDQTSVTIPNVAKSKCVNNGALCRNYHYLYQSLLWRRCCVPKAAGMQNVTGTVTVSNGSGCSKTVTYMFVNATDCKCTNVGGVTLS